MRKSESNRLELFWKAVIFSPCRFTNFIARNANGTANSWFEPGNGKALNVHIAARLGWRRSFRLSLRPAAAIAQRSHKAVPASRVRAACAARDEPIRIDFVLGLAR